MYIVRFEVHKGTCKSREPDRDGSRGGTTIRFERSRGPIVRLKRLGKTELRCSELGFGCARIASLSTPASGSEVAATIAEALDHSVSFFDTADVYGQGDSERLLGRLLKGKRDRVVLCTKAGLRVRASQRIIRAVKPFANPLIRHWRTGRDVAVGVRRQAEGQCFEPEHLRKQIAGSLRRLDTDHLDLFLLHNPPVSVLKREEVFTLLEQRRRAGDIRHYGVSCGTLSEAEAALDIEGVSCLQIEVNPLALSERLENVLGAARQAGVGVLAREPLAGGALLGAAAGGVDRGNTGSRSPADIALKWLAQRHDVDVVIVGMTRRSHLRKNLAALEGPPVSAAEIANLVQRFDVSASAP